MSDIEQKPILLRDAVATLEKSMTRDALKHCGWNINAAARRLGVSRWAMYRLIARHGLGEYRS